MNFRFRLIPPIEESPELLAAGKSVFGRIVLLCVFGIGLWLNETAMATQLMIVLTATTFLPHNRRTIITCATFYWLFFASGFGDWTLHQASPELGHIALTISFQERIHIILGVLIACGLYLKAVTTYPSFWFFKKPLRNLVVLYIILFWGASYLPSTEKTTCYLWATLIIFGKYIWYLGYSLNDRLTKRPTSFFHQLGHYWPFWGSANTPIPKGSAYLKKIEAQDSSALALSQLKAVKLIYWTFYLTLLQTILQNVLFGEPGPREELLNLPQLFHLPKYWDTFSDIATGQPFIWYHNWIATISVFLMQILDVSIWGHAIVATCRMAGFLALRNTYKPLQSQSLLDFWNRFHFYFKELLVDFFFYPTFLRYFKKQPKFRLFFATLVAAGFGNYLYHFLKDYQYILERGFIGATISNAPSMAYCLVLGISIGVSQIRRKSGAQDRTNQSWLKRKILAPFFVLTFYCVINVFDNPGRNTEFEDHVHYLLSLINMDLR